MISFPRAPATTDTAATATAATAATDAPATAFDAILSLETVAATPTATQDLADLVSLCPDLCADELGEVSAGETEESDTDDADPAEAGGALAFLASLLALPAIPPAQAPADGGADCIADSSYTGDSPAQPAGQQTVQPAPAPAIPATLAPVTDGGASQADGSSANKFLVPVPTIPDPAAGNSAQADTSQDGDSNSPAPVRTADWFNQAPRHVAGPERNAIVTHARDPRWVEELGTRIALMVRGGESAASLQLSPVDLGPLDISITVRDSQASIHFGAAQAETRNLLEASIPRLREMLAAQGFQLMDASVSQGFARQSRSDGSPAPLRLGDPEPDLPTTTHVVGTSLLDTYA